MSTQKADQIHTIFAALHESACGTKRTLQPCYAQHSCRDEQVARYPYEPCRKSVPVVPRCPCDSRRKCAIKCIQSGFCVDARFPQNNH
jgi:hypothetical protein